MRRRMALFASDRRVFSFKRIPRQPVVKLPHGRFPVNQRKIHAVVLQMAAHALFAVRILHLQPRMVAPLLGKQLRNFLVATKAFEGGRAGAELVATRAFRCSAERLMRFRKRPGRDLRSCRKARANKEDQVKQKSGAPKRGKRRFRKREDLSKHRCFLQGNEKHKRVAR